MDNHNQNSGLLFEVDPSEILLNVQGLSKVYRHNSVSVEAVCDVNFQILRGEFASIMGPSGCGKSTLLYCLAGMASATKGQIFLDGDDLVSMPDSERVRARRDKMGFVFQRFNLMPTLTIQQNVELAMKLKTGSVNPEKVRRAMEQVNIDSWADTRPRHLSEGQKQRAAIARAIASEPEVLFADEPTGNLDSDNSVMIMDLFLSLNRKGQTIIMVTHNPLLAEMTQHTIQMIDGRIVKQ